MGKGHHLRQLSQLGKMPLKTLNPFFSLQGSPACSSTVSDSNSESTSDGPRFCTGLPTAAPGREVAQRRHRSAHQGSRQAKGCCRMGQGWAPVPRGPTTSPRWPKLLQQQVMLSPGWAGTRPFPSFALPKQCGPSPRAYTRITPPLGTSPANTKQSTIPDRNFRELLAGHHPPF